jgi:hypothetical protein
MADVMTPTALPEWELRNLVLAEYNKPGRQRVTEVELKHLGEFTSPNWTAYSTPTLTDFGDKRSFLVAVYTVGRRYDLLVE